MPATKINTHFGLGRLAAESLWRRKRKTVIALLAVALASTLVTALVTVYGGVERGVSRQFRSFGPNLVIAPKARRAWLQTADAQRIQAVLGPQTAWAGLVYAVAQIRPAGRAGWRTIAVAGADLQAMRRLNPAWHITPTLTPMQPSPDTQVWLGTQAARVLQANLGSSLSLRYGGNQAQWQVAGIVQSGGSADDQIFAPLGAARQLTGIAGYTTFEIAAPATGLRSILQRLRTALPNAAVSPVRQIAAGEGDLLLRTRGLLFYAALVILMTLALCGIATLAGLALERRKEFGIMKAIGAGNRQVLAVFVLEALALGAAGGGLGLAAGSAIARGIGEAAYGTALLPSGWGLALSLAVALGLAVVAALAPFPLILQARPAEILRSE